MSNIALFPGSFDPITIGHVDIVKRALPLFDKIVVGVGHNSQKKYLFDLEQRIEHINLIFKDTDKVEVANYQELTVTFCKKIGAKYILRGLRSAADFEYERQISQLNQSMDSELETVFLISQPKYSHISSTIVREIIKFGGDLGEFLPKEVKV